MTIKTNTLIQSILIILKTAAGDHSLLVLYAWNLETKNIITKTTSWLQQILYFNHNNNKNRDKKLKPIRQ